MHDLRRMAVLLMSALFCLILCGGAAAEITPLPVDMTPGLPYDFACCGGKDCYEDPSLKIDVFEDEIYGIKYMYAIVKIADASQLRTAFAYRYNSQYTATAMKMAEANNAVLAINADYHNFHDTGFIVRQGKVYRDLAYRGFDVLMIDQNGDFHTMIEANKSEVNDWVEAHSEYTIVNSFNFGPVLVQDGQRTREDFTDARNSMEIRGHSRFARTAICQLDQPLTYLCLCCQGDQDGKGVGLTLNELYDCVAAIDEKLTDYRVMTAYNLDGGYSSTMVLGGEKINWPENGVKREIQDIIYFASAWTEE